jgi:dTDP-4-amino-4,6-dideoxygalactose transaminase
MAADQARLLSELKTSGIDCSKLHLRNDIYAGFNAKSAYLPGTDSVSAELMALPCGWWLDRAQLDRIVSVVRRAVGA